MRFIISAKKRHYVNKYPSLHHDNNNNETTVVYVQDSGNEESDSEYLDFS